MMLYALVYCGGLFTFPVIVIAVIGVARWLDRRDAQIHRALDIEDPQNAEMIRRHQAGQR